MTASLTPWFDGSSVKPAHIGVYKIGGFYKGFSHWNGSLFNGVWTTKDLAFTHRDFGRGLHVYKWRGLSEKPK